jgi:hypothetical protein
MSHAWAGGSTRRWRDKIRPAVLLRGGYQCQIKVPGTWTTRRGEVQSCLGMADCVHHTQGKAVTGDEDLRYLVAACTPCNLHVGDPTRAADPAPLPVGWC